MAKYRLTSDSKRSVSCDVLNESADQYVVRFRNGVVRCVNKDNVYEFDQIDEAVLDDIRNLGSKVGGAIRNGYEKVKLFLSRIFLSDDHVVLTDSEGEVIEAVHPANIMTSEKARELPISFVPSIDDVETVEAAGGRAVVINNYQFDDDNEYHGYTGDESANESKKIDWCNALYEYHSVPFYDSHVGVDDIPTEAMLRSSRIDLKSRAGHPTADMEDIITRLSSEYGARLEGRTSRWDPLCIWGAPGIGKSSIIKGLKEDIKNDYGTDIRICTINANALGAHDLSQSGHVKVEVENPDGASAVLNAMGKDLGTTDSSRVVRKGLFVDKVKTLPQTWLPVYDKVEGDEEGNKIRNSVANGGHWDKSGKTWIDGDGGILFIDEWSRINPITSNALMTLPSERTVSQSDSMTLGSKWVVVVAANRAEDMTEYNKKQYTSTVETAKTTRFEDVNFLPKPTDWFNWCNKINPTTGRPNVEPEIVSYVQSSILGEGGITASSAGRGTLGALDNYENYAKSDYYNMFRVASQNDYEKIEKEPRACPRSWEAANTTLVEHTVMSAKNPRLVRTGRVKTSISELTGQEILDMCYPFLGEGPSKRFAKYIVDIYDGFKESDAQNAIASGNNAQYDFMKKSWIDSTNVMKKAMEVINPALLRNLNTYQDDNGVVSEDAVMNIYRFFAMIAIECCANGSAESHQTFVQLVDAFQNDVKNSKTVQVINTVALKTFVEDAANAIKTGAWKKSTDIE